MLVLPGQAYLTGRSEFPDRHRRRRGTPGPVGAHPFTVPYRGSARELRFGAPDRVGEIGHETAAKAWASCGRYWRRWAIPQESLTGNVHTTVQGICQITRCLDLLAAARRISQTCRHARLLWYRDTTPNQRQEPALPGRSVDLLFRLVNAPSLALAAPSRAGLCQRSCAARPHHDPQPRRPLHSSE
jgi:hypothetical protein